MTRINLVDPSELHRNHLVAEYREIVRVFALARKNQYEIHKNQVACTSSTKQVKDCRVLLQGFSKVGGIRLVMK